MDTTTIIIVLAIILFILIALNHIKISQTTVTTTEVTRKASCSQTTFGCCPDGVNSKINFYGTNCPGYRPPPGYLPTPLREPPLPRPLPPPPRPLPPQPPTPIGGCSGTRYGCCPNNITAKINTQGSNCLLK
jgi:hypothetical protein